jgi:hypothetical protein
MSRVYPAANPERSRAIRGGRVVQKAQPRDIGALALVVALFVVLFVLSVALGRRPAELPSTAGSTNVSERLPG